MLHSTLVIAQVGGSSRPGLVQSFVDSGPMAWAVAALLLGLSIGSWSIMVGKYLFFRRAESQSAKFLERFRSSQRFSEVGAVTSQLSHSPLVGPFQAGYAEIDAQIKARRRDSEDDGYRITSLNALERSLRRAAGAEMRLLARGTPFLATTAAASPFIGLFGTVWGIMGAFHDIAVTGSTSLVAVAPGIAEALINTALGLVAAIPALVGYNYYAARLRRFRTDLDDFALEFINLAERNFT